MEQLLINLISGAVGGNAAGKASPSIDMGTLLNSITGVIGGAGIGQIVSLLMPAISGAMASGNFSIGGIIAQVISGGAGGAILTALVGLIKNKMA